MASRIGLSMMSTGVAKSSITTSGRMSVSRSNGLTIEHGPWAAAGEGVSFDTVEGDEQDYWERDPEFLGHSQIFLEALEEFPLESYLGD